MIDTKADNFRYLRNNNLQEVGKELYDLISELYPICRSITGDGVRQTINILRRTIPITMNEVPTGTKVFDWTVPREWNIRDAYIKNSEGKRIVDFKNSNLHIVNYSTPVRKTMSLSELKEHLFTLPEKPDWIPYRTTYYRENWGFCLAHNQMIALKEDQYEVCIDSSLKDGSLTYGEFYLPGETSNEVMVSAHICHPSLCNDNLSGIAIAAYLARTLSSMKLRYSYRFLFMPATIGPITWLCLNESSLLKIKHGIVLACAGDSGKTTYKRSRQGSTEVDRAVAIVLRDSNKEYNIEDFIPYGYDERQYCSPGFNLPVGCLMRTPHGRFPEYHTSADNLNFVKPGSLADSFSKILSTIYILEYNRRFLNKNPKCEPQLGRRGIYRALSDRKDGGKQELALLWVLNLSDGEHTLLEIAERSHLTFEMIYHAATMLVEHDLLEVQPE